MGEYGNDKTTYLGLGVLLRVSLGQEKQFLPLVTMVEIFSTKVSCNNGRVGGGGPRGGAEGGIGA